MVKKPKKLDIDTILKLSPLEERIYRHRCVEGWSMVIPWVGIPLSALIKQADPLPSAKFVAFQTVSAPDQMPNQKRDVLDWPYVEGLRMDEAMHPLSILAVGLYDEVLPNVDGAPLRLVVPWKYGFKGIKAIVKISFTDQMPPTTWNKMASNEYGFYSNVNPQKDHPRWSQATERHIGEFRKRPTLCSTATAIRLRAFILVWTYRKITDETAAGKIRPRTESAGVYRLSRAGVCAYMEGLP